MENPNAISDIGTAATLAQAAARSPAYNVKINLMELANEALTVDVRSKIDTLLSEIKNHVPNVEEATGSFLR
jgi:formiminotetrahydrofolate cyclodeaminase